MMVMMPRMMIKLTTVMTKAWMMTVLLLMMFNADEDCDGNNDDVDVEHEDARLWALMHRWCGWTKYHGCDVEAYCALALVSNVMPYV